MSYLIFNGINSTSLGVLVGGQGTYNAPKRDVKKTSISGRNGDLVQDNGKFLNAPVPYTIVIKDEFEEKARAVRNWLLTPKTYVRLEDSYHPNEFRLARLESGVDFKTGRFNKYGVATVVFDCKPQRFLKSGETSVTFSGSGSIENPTDFASKPLIRVNGTGNGVLWVNDTKIDVTGLDGFIDIDCELMDCYKDGSNMNLNVTIRGDFPTLKAGTNNFSFSGGITSVSIKGRWWHV